MALYEIENVSKNGHVFVELRGVQTLKPGQKKVVDINDADRYHPSIVALEGDHVEIRPFKGTLKKVEPKKDEEPAKPADPKKP